VLLCKWNIWKIKFLIYHLIFLKDYWSYKILVKHKNIVSQKQLLRNATSIGANAEEANAAQSKKDKGLLT
jgi:four helix bundle protein